MSSTAVDGLQQGGHAVEEQVHALLVRHAAQEEQKRHVGLASGDGALAKEPAEQRDLGGGMVAVRAQLGASATEREAGVASDHAASKRAEEGGVARARQQLRCVGGSRANATHTRVIKSEH